MKLSITAHYGITKNFKYELKNMKMVCFDTGAHKKLVKKGFVVPNYNFNIFKKKIIEAWREYA